MRINKAATAYGLVTFCIGISSAIIGHYLPDGAWHGTALTLATFGSLISAASIDLMSEIKSSNER